MSKAKFKYAIREAQSKSKQKEFEEIGRKEIKAIKDRLVEIKAKTVQVL